MFLQVSVILFTGRGGIPACLAGGIPACLAGLWGCIPACLAGFQAHTQGRAWGVWPWGVSRPTPGGSLQVHTQMVSRPRPGGGGGLPGPHPGWCIPACTEADHPSWWLLLWAVRILLECILVLGFFVLLTNLWVPILIYYFRCCNWLKPSREKHWQQHDLSWLRSWYRLYT